MKSAEKVLITMLEESRNAIYTGRPGMYLECRSKLYYSAGMHKFIEIGNDDVLECGKIVYCSA